MTLITRTGRYWATPTALKAHKKFVSKKQIGIINKFLMFFILQVSMVIAQGLVVSPYRVTVTGIFTSHPG
jgi:hypothetical protein